jgi:replication factor C subunit 2/4
MWAQKKVNLPPGRHKIIILDEADSMTSAAQQALRRTMELYSNTTRFALACNTSSKIIEAIQSRCAIVRFTRLTDKQILQRLLEVIKAEKVSYTEDGLEAILFTAEGDMRQALNNLQSTCAGYGLVNRVNVYKVCDEPHPSLIHKMITTCIEGKLDEALAKLVYLWSLGYSAVDILSTMFRVVKTYNVDEYYKLEFIREIGLAHMRATRGMNTLLQLKGLVARLCTLQFASPNAQLNFQ